MNSDATLASDFEWRSPVWIDTDAACGYRATADPDDCFALLVLVGASELAVVGVSTVFGNAPLEDSDRITRRVFEEWRGDALPPAVFKGLAHPLDELALETMPEGVLALRDALSNGPIRIVALGPLTNIAAAIRGRLTLARNIVEVIAVMGKREGHLFHPSEGARVNLLFGHGPIFQDLNFARDVLAVRTLMNSGVRITLLPYELARQVSLTGEDVTRFERAGGGLAWVARSSRGWLAYWRTVVGRDGFYPFDLLAAAYAIDDRHLRLQSRIRSCRDGPKDRALVSLRVAARWGSGFRRGQDPQLAGRGQLLHGSARDSPLVASGSPPVDVRALT